MIKNLIKQLLCFLHLDISKNLKYDRLTKKLILENLSSDSNCIDVGAHRGEILNLIVKRSPLGHHYAFEPIPKLYEELKLTYGNSANILPYALSTTDSNAEFNIVLNDLAYSGLKKRKYAISDPHIEKITVQVRSLDELLDDHYCIQFMKIDVEGGEYDVLKGAEKLLKRSKAIVIFEFGIGASDFYGTSPDAMYEFLNTTLGYSLFTLSEFHRNKIPLSKKEFQQYYFSNEEYYFVAQSS